MHYALHVLDAPGNQLLFTWLIFISLFFYPGQVAVCSGEPSSRVGLRWLPGRSSQIPSGQPGWSRTPSTVLATGRRAVVCSSASSAYPGRPSSTYRCQTISTYRRSGRLLMVEACFLRTFEPWRKTSQRNQSLPTLTCWWGWWRTKVSSWGCICRPAYSVCGSNL